MCSCGSPQSSQVFHFELPSAVGSLWLPKWGPVTRWGQEVLSCTRCMGVSGSRNICARHPCLAVRCKAPGMLVVCSIYNIVHCWVASGEVPRSRMTNFSPHMMWEMVLFSFNRARHAYMR